MTKRPATKQEHALTVINALLDDLDGGKLRGTNALQRLKRAATLVNDTEALAWINAEEGGYPLHTDSYEKALEIVAKALKKDNPTPETIAQVTKEIYRPIPDYRKGYFSRDSGYGGETLVLGSSLGEYEALLDTMRKQPKVNFTFDHNGVRYAWSQVRLQRLTDGVIGGIYKHATRLQEILLFGQIPAHAIERTFSFVDAELFRILPGTAERLTAAYQNLAETRAENWVNVADTCRRVIKDFADHVYPASTEQAHGLDVTDDKYLNRIRAFVKDRVESRRNAQQLETVLLVLAELVARTDNLASRSVHEGAVTRYEAERILLYTYLAIGDVLVIAGMATRADAAKQRPSLSKLTVDELVSVLGLRRPLAEALVQARRSKGFSTWEDVAAINGMGPKTLANLQSKASL